MVFGVCAKVKSDKERLKKIIVNFMLLKIEEEKLYKGLVTKVFLFRKA